MPAPLATISSGATSGSTSVTVLATVTNGTAIVVFRGEFQLGSGFINSGSVVVTLSSALQTGDVIQASINEKGSNAGTPVVVKASNIRLSGWKSPTEIRVEFIDGTTATYPVDQFFATYGYVPASLNDPVGLNSSVPAEYEPAPTADIAFDVAITQANGSTSISVQNIQNIKGGALARWNGGSWGNSLTTSYASNQTVTVDVRGGDDATSRYATKVLTIAIVALPATPAPDAALVGASFCYYEQNVMRVMLNGRVSAEARVTVQGVVGAWQPMIPYQLDYYDSIFGGVTDGAVVINIRVVGEADSSKWRTISFTKGY